MVNLFVMEFCYRQYIRALFGRCDHRTRRLQDQVVQEGMRMIRGNMLMTTLYPILLPNQLCVHALIIIVIITVL